jgi:hypothetical protein
MSASGKLDCRRRKTAVLFDPTSVGRRQGSGKPQGVTFDDEVHVLDPAAEQQIAHGASDENSLTFSVRASVRGGDRSGKRRGRRSSPGTAA